MRNRVNDGVEKGQRQTQKHFTRAYVTINAMLATLYVYQALFSYRKQKSIQDTKILYTIDE